MDIFNKAVAQLSDLFRSMTPGARITAALLLAVVVISLGYLFRSETTSADTYLMNGESLSAGDLHAAAAAFGKAHLEGYEIQGSQIRVPRGQQAAYMAALADAKALPANIGSYFKGALDAGGIWETAGQQDYRHRIAHQEELQLIIRNMAGIDKASVIINMENKSGLNRDPVKTASVAVSPVGSDGLNESQVESIRNLVSFGAGVNPDSVTVVDLKTGKTYHNDADGGGMSGQNSYLAYKMRWESDLRAKVLASLSYIPNLTVEANVQLDREKFNHLVSLQHSKPIPLRTNESSKTSNTEGSGGASGRPGYQGQSNANTPTALSSSSQKGSRTEEEQTQSETVNTSDTEQRESETVGLTPESARVAIAIPNSYFEKVWRARSPAAAGQESKAPDPAALEQIRSEEFAKIKSLVAALLPPAKGVTDLTELVTVTSLQDIKPADIPLPGAGQLVLVWFSQYWSTLGLIGLGLVSLVVLRSMVRAAPGATETAPVQMRVAAEPEARTNESPESVAARRLRRFSVGGPSLRDELSEMVKEDPDAAANILRSWIGQTT